MEGWNDSRFCIRIQAPNFDRIVLINKLILITRPAAWDENHDIWIMPTNEAAGIYSEVSELLKSTPAHVVNLATNQESVSSVGPKGVDRWRMVARLLTMQTPWTGYKLPFGEHSYQQDRPVGYLYKGIFNRENKALSNGRSMDSRVFVDDCVVTVWYRYADNQKVRDFVRAASGQGWGYT